MKREYFIDLYDTIVRKAQELNKGKSQDYASTEDVLANFKRLSEAAKILGIDITTPYGYSMFMVLQKIDRINNLCKKGTTAVNESMQDSFVDALNYLLLTLACIVEEQAEK